MNPRTPKGDERAAYRAQTDLAKSLRIDESRHASGARYVGWQHPDKPIQYRMVAQPGGSENPSGWTLLDVTDPMHPIVLDAGVMNRDVAFLHCDTADYMKPRRLAAAQIARIAAERGL